MNRLKRIKIAIDILFFPFSLTMMYQVKKNEIQEIGQKVRINGSRDVHTVFSKNKNAKQTVILDAGLSCCSLDWCYIQPEISKFANVLSFDRPGYGWSSISDYPYTSEYVVNDLVQILKELKIKPPYILVGHSFGSLNMRLFASKYPEKVAALILIDPVHENRYISNQWDNNRKKDYRKSLLRFQFGYLTSGNGLPRLLKQPVGRKYLPEPYQRHAKFVGYHPKSYETVYKEFLFSEESALQIKHSAKLREDLPVTVISSNNVDPTWIEHHKMLSELTRETVHINTNNNHSIHLENPKLVIDIISEVVSYNSEFN